MPSVHKSNGRGASTPSTRKPLRTGAVGLSCAALGARHVALTDFDAGVVELLRENARNNYLRAGCDCYELDVAKPPTEPRAEFDLVVGSECVYYGACDAVPALVLSLIHI